MRRARAATWRPTFPRWWRRRRLTHSAPIRMVCPPHVPVPFAANLEDLYVPNAEKVEAAVHLVVRHAVKELV